MNFRLPAVLLLLGPGLSMAQSTVTAECLVSDASTQPPLIREEVSGLFTAARECIANADGGCAETAIGNIDDSDLNTDELGILALATGDMEALQGSSRQARREYRRVLRLRDVHPQIRRTGIERLTIQHFEDENYDNAIEQLEELECGDWTPSLLLLRARAYFRDEEFENAKLSAEAAVGFQESAGVEVPAAWQSLLAASIQNAERVATEEVICTRERTTNSSIPVRVCTTRAQREAEVDAAQDFMRNGGGTGGDVLADPIN